jgi:predicted Zn-dependent protease
MLTEAKCREMFEKIRRACPVDEFEVLFQSTNSALTRFANNIIHQNVAEEKMSVSVRVLLNGKTARASGNKTDDDSLKRLAEQAHESAKLQPENPDLLPLIEDQLHYQEVNRYCEETAALTPEARAEAVGKVTALAEKNKLNAAGIFSSGVTSEVLMSSRGVWAEHRETKAEFSVTFLNGGSGWAKGNFVSVKDLPVQELAESACQKALDNHDPQELAPGAYTVILEPAAVLDFLGFIFYDFAGTAVLDKQSCFTGQLGTKIFGENISITDDVFHPLQAGAPWDGEGMPRQRVELVENGVLKNLVYSRQTAKKMDAKPTGHGFLLPNEYGEAPMNLVFTGGKTSVEEMVRSTERGILVTRLWYIREVDPFEKILTGMTRDGTFLVEDGKVGPAIKNFRFNQSVKEALHNVEQMGEPVRAAGEESFEMVVPPMKIRDFRFTEVTKF